MKTGEIEKKISFSKKGIIILENVKFSIGKNTAAVNLQTSGQVKNQTEFMCFSKYKQLSQETEFWLNFNNLEIYYNFARIIYDLFEEGKENIAIKNIEKFGVNYYWCTVRDTKILFWWLKEDTLSRFESMTDVEGKNLIKIEF